MTHTKSIPVKVSIIIPVYNGEAYLQRCLDSVYQQSLAAYEIIAIDDGTTDGTARIMRENAKQHRSIKIITQANHGQGYARNRAIEAAAGDYVLFLDADDWLDPAAIASLLEASDRGSVDLVHCGWRAGNTGAVAHKQSYLPREVFPVEQLDGDDCDEFLRLPNYFSVNNLFRRQFLLDHRIKFGEGYVYEDNEFMVAVANHASTIRFVNQPLYSINFRGASSTRGTVASDKHYRDFMLAIAKSYDLLQPRLEQSRVYLANYFLEKFTIYYQYRVPNRYKREYRHAFVDIMSRQHIEEHGALISKLLHTCLSLGVFTRRRYTLFWLCILYKTRFLPIVKR